jgi:hypothetical protein
LLRTISEDQNNETAKLILDLDIYTDTAWNEPDPKS